MLEECFLAQENSPITDFVKKGGGYHHLCFEVDDIHLELEKMKKNGARVIVDVVKGSPADLGGLSGYTGTVSDNVNSYPSGGDILTAINTIPIKSMSDLLSLLFSDYSPGDSITFTILRDSSSLDLDITLISRPQ